jgi:20S proteasome alpha/beta subunit
MNSQTLDKPTLPNRPPNKYIRPIPQPKRAKAMTVVAGFVCSNGAVLAADTEISFENGGKRNESKIFPINRTMGCYLTYTGYSDFVKELVDSLREETKTVDTAEEILTIIKNRYQNMTSRQQNKALPEERSWAHVLVTVRKDVREPWKEKLHDYNTLLYLARDDHFFKIDTYAVLGIGENQAASIFEPFCNKYFSTRLAAYTAIDAIRKVKNSVQGVGGATELVEIMNDDSLPFADFGKEEVQEIEKEYEFFEKTAHPVLMAFVSNLSQEKLQAALGAFGHRLSKRRKERKLTRP